MMGRQQERRERPYSEGGGVVTEAELEKAWKRYQGHGAGNCAICAGSKATLSKMDASWVSRLIKWLRGEG